MARAKKSKPKKQVKLTEEQRILNSFNEHANKYLLKNSTYSEFQYRGNVSYEMIFNNKRISTQHNDGTKELQRAFALFMSGNVVEAEAYLPDRFDIFGDGASILFAPLPISGSRYETADGDGCAVHTASVDIGQLKTTVPERQKCILKMISKNGLELANCTIDSNDTICLISNNVSGLITGIMKVKV